MQAQPGRRRSLSDVFDRKSNALNAVRLTMAIGVIFWHAFPLTGRDITYPPLRQAMGEIWVDGFFAVSGFLITSSWLNNPNVRAYVEARLLRILPAFYACLVVTAFVFVPLSHWMQGGDIASVLKSFAPAEYILKNSGIWMTQFDVGGTPVDIPLAHTWNGSLWTLGWEALCYLAILALGVVGLLRTRWALPVAFVSAWTALVLSHLHPISTYLSIGARFGVMFVAGALVYKYRSRLACSWWAVLGCVAVAVGSMWLSDYRIIGATFWSYAVIATGALIKSRHLNLTTDLSYGTYIYAFPIQQLLIIAGAAVLNPLLLAVATTIVTLGVAFISWTLIERPANEFKRRLHAKRSVPMPDTTCIPESLTATRSVTPP
jgi:peptidoglycan/LPS O-acetylase OafA/YrhL